jgi:hypothetical protein
VARGDSRPPLLGTLRPRGAEDTFWGSMHSTTPILHDSISPGARIEGDKEVENAEEAERVSLFVVCLFWGCEKEYVSLEY